ncbi:MAG: alanine:cation symporter family protein, partial [Gammaproteobacteria bacterium]|nr:alanine:cation symporter family protein [Gammaproteobacteria bacterium]
FTVMRHTLDVLRGRFDDPNDPGEISHFQALSSALSGTIGLGNIAGVAIAVAVGGPGAVFWMWVAALVGMATKFFTCTLSCMYRKEDEDGIAQGGPMYFIEVGLGPRFRPLAILFAACGMVGALPLFQANQLSGMLQAQWSFPALGTGLIAMVLVGVVEVGGIRRVGRVTSRVVPSMCLLYMAACLYVLVTNLPVMPEVFLRIFSNAFGTDAALGGAAGLAFAQVMTTGVQRAAFSNEAGIGTEAMAHGAARTDEPVREGLVAMLGPFIDTHVVCTLTALVILSSGVTTEGGGIVMTVTAFERAMPVLGPVILTCVVILFAVSTMMTYSYYSVKCARYLFGKRLGSHYLYVYLVLIPVAAMWTQNTAVNIIDTFFALMAIPTLFSSLALSRRVVSALDDYLQRMGLKGPV